MMGEGVVPLLDEFDVATRLEYIGFIALQSARIACVDAQSSRSTAHDVGVTTAGHVAFRLGSELCTSIHLVSAEAFT